VFPEFEPAGNVGAALIRRYFHNLPERGIGEQTVNGSLALNVAEVDVAEAQVEPIPLAIGPEGWLVQQIRPWRQERDTAQLSEIGRMVQDVLSVYLHLPHSIAGRRQNRNFYAVRPIAQMNDGDAVIECFAGSVAQKWNFSAN
jgi:hypothetical protein